MVFKRVLKGIGRLMLTTAVMCGVGLFLCSSEVKAAVEATLAAGTGDNQGGFIVTFTAESSDKVSEINEIQLLSNSEVLYTMTVNQSYDTNTDINNNYTISPSDFIKSSAVIAKDFNNGGKAEITKAKVSYTANASSTAIEATGPVFSKEIYKISIPSFTESGGASSAPYDTDATNTTSAFEIKVGDRTYAEGKPGYGYAGESVLITPSGNPDYYINYYTGSTAPTWDSGKFLEPGATYSVDRLIGNITDLKVQYFPRFTQVWYNIPPAKGTVYLGSDSTKTISFNTECIKFGKPNLDDLTPSNDRKVILSNMAFVPDLNGSSNINKWSGKYDSSTSTVEIKFGDSSNKALANLEQVGVAKVSAVALKPGASSSDPGTTPVINNATCPSPASLNVYAYPTGVAILKNGSAVTSDKINVSATNEYTLKVLPGGADQTIDYATVNATGYSHASFSKENNKLKITGTTSGTDNITVTAKVKTGESTTIDKTATLTVTVAAFDKDKTVSKINGSNENYITVGDYKLDVASLVSKYATDGTNHIDGITPKAIKITSGSEYAEVVDSTKIKGKKEGTVELSIFLNTTNTSTTPDLTGVKIGVYPMPTATYSSSNRTLTVKMPTKVSTGYGEEKNIRKTTGFKLLLEDSSGNTLYEYTDSKYQKVLSSSSDKTVSYTVTASDIEGMVTSAASNGKFSSETTPVKFKVIPMGYKQSNSDDETIKAKDEIAGKTDAVNVYKVSASGTNFSSTAAYGLDGQTVSLTATPNSGYTFKQWLDGNTSNPRQIKVSASGTRSFQAVAGDRVANSIGAGGTDNSDNSELYDDVPKTAESNSAIWLIVFMVFAVMGTTYALYLQLRAANSKHDR